MPARLFRDVGRDCLAHLRAFSSAAPLNARPRRHEWHEALDEPSGQPYPSEGLAGSRGFNDHQAQFRERQAQPGDNTACGSGALATLGAEGTGALRRSHNHSYTTKTQTSACTSPAPSADGPHRTLPLHLAIARRPETFSFFKFRQRSLHPCLCDALRQRDATDRRPRPVSANRGPSLATLPTGSRSAAHGTRPIVMSPFPTRPAAGAQGGASEDPSSQHAMTRSTRGAPDPRRWKTPPPRHKATESVRCVWCPARVRTMSRHSKFARGANKPMKWLMKSKKSRGVM